MRYVLFYESAEGVMEKAPLHFAAHKPRFDEFAASDPFVLHGVVGNWYVRAWNEALVPQ